MRFYDIAAFLALNTTGVKPVRVQRSSVDVVWNRFVIHMFVCYVYIYIYECICD